MPTITNALVRLHDESGPVLRADCYGNNATVECPRCLKYPILLIARTNQRGSSAANPGRCRHCECSVFIADDLSVDRLEVVTVNVVDLSE
jgi:hypothetical protein